MKLLKISSVFLILILSGCSKDDGGISFEEQLALDLAIIDNHILANDIDAEKHESGIWYINSEIGEGASPSIGNRVVVKLKSEKLDGTLLSEDTIGITISLLNPTIIALQLMIPEMNIGGEMKIYAPSGYCFGSVARTGVPANTNLIFSIELLAIVKNEEDQLQADLDIIDEFLLEKNIEAKQHESGIRYTIIGDEVSDENQLIRNQITVNYKGTLLNGFVFDQSTSEVQFSLNNLISAWKIMIPIMEVDSEITIYSPSKYCYGRSGSGSIPPNTILVFEIKLISVGD